jgi:(2Fe-2S) ferredoxin
VTLEDVEEIIDEHVIGGNPVTRLMITANRFQQDFD